MMHTFNKNEFYSELEDVFRRDSKMIRIIAGLGALFFGMPALYYFITELRDCFL